MKIIIISDAWKPQINGVVRTYEYLIPELEKRNHSVKVIGPSDFPFTIAMPGYSEIRLALFARNCLSQMIEEYSPDTIHIATEGPLGMAAQKYCKKSNISFSTSYHTQFPDYIKRRIKQIMPFAAKFFYKKAVQKIVRFHNSAASVLVTTNSIKQQLLDWGIQTPIAEFTRGVDLSTFNLSKNDQPLYADLKKPVALYVGRIAIEKSIEDFLDMKWQGSKVVVGQGPDETALKEKYPEAVFVGKKTGDDLSNHYRCADLFVFPSTTDTFGMVLVEALACGLPIAAYHAPGPQDIVTKNYLGVLNEDLSIAAQEAIKQSEYTDRRHDLVRTHYTWEKAADQFINACPTINEEEAA